MAHDDEPLSPAEQDLIQELQQLYREEAQAVDHRLERVWQRLDARRTATQQSKRTSKLRALPIGPLRRESHPMPNPLTRLHISRLSTRISALAAAVLLVALVGGLTAGIILVRHGGTNTQAKLTPTATASPTPSPTPVSSSADLTFSDLEMKDASNGWASAYQNPISSGEPAEILHTTDGGLHWKNVTPHLSAQIEQPGNAMLRPYGSGAGTRTEEYLTGSVAWVLQLPNHFFKTTDGGQTWQEETAPGESISQFTFLDTLHGWVIATYAGALVTFRTTDGGATWTQMQSSANAFPPQTPFWGVRFLNLTTGWAVFLNDPLEGSVTVYKTVNSGATWHAQHLTLPAGAAAPVSVNPPQFFNATDGIIQVGFDGGINGQLRPYSGGGTAGLYLTHDGGATWEGPIILNGLEFPDFIDALHGWALNSNGSGLLTTSDSGRNWATVATSSNFIDVSFTNFVSSQIGWALQEGVYGGYSLLKTTDGGQTWTQLNFNISN